MRGGGGGAKAQRFDRRNFEMDILGERREREGGGAEGPDTMVVITLDYCVACLAYSD